MRRNCERHAGKAVGDAMGRGSANDAAWIVAAIGTVSAASVIALASVSAAVPAMVFAASTLSSTQQSGAALVMAFTSAATSASASSPASATTAVSTVSRCTNIADSATIIGADASAGAVDIAGATAGGCVEELATDKLSQVMSERFLHVAVSMPACGFTADRMSHETPPVLGIG